jgi:hypothetical protein
MGFSDAFNETQDKLGIGGGGNFFKFKKGENRLRILTGVGKGNKEIIAYHWPEPNKSVACFGIKEGCPYHGEGALKNDKNEEIKPGLKAMVYVLNKNGAEPVIQTAEIVWTIATALDKLQLSSEWGFKDYPMNYDVVVTYDSNEAPAKMYSTVASAKNMGPVSAEVLEKLATLPTIASIIEKKKEKAKNDSLGVKPETSGGDVQIGSTEELPTVNFDEGEIRPEDIPF